MLTKLRVKNFLSYKNYTELDFTTTNYKFLSDTNTYNGTLKGAAFLGGNASGKTNSIRAIQFLFYGIFSDKLEFDNYLCMFSDDDEMILEYEFAIDNSIIEYQITYHSKEKHLNENLYIDKKEVMNRTASSATTELTEKKNYIDLKQENLFLKRIIMSSGVDDIKLNNWFEFLRNSKYVNGAEYYSISYTNDYNNLYDYLKNGGKDRVNEFLSSIEYDQNINLIDNEFIDNLNVVDKEKYAIEFKRNGLEIGIPYRRESLGNKSLINLLPNFFSVLDKPSMLVIDEFSSGFHNYLEIVLIKYFMKNSKNSQLFLVTHSTNILSTSLLRPDQIYTTSFKGSNGTEINRVSNDKPRESQNMEKMYLSGIFDGIPHYKDNIDEN